MKEKPSFTKKDQTELANRVHVLVDNLNTAIEQAHAASLRVSLIPQPDAAGAKMIIVASVQQVVVTDFPNPRMPKPEPVPPKNESEN